jgi:hypothetical protein
MEKYGFVYLWRDRKHNRYYIGCHWGTEDDGYVCSSRWMRNTYKRRPDDFKRRILVIVYTNKKDLFNEEFKWISLIKESEIKSRYYNLNIKATGHWSTYPENIKTIKDKISHATKQAMAKPENKERYLEGLKKRNQIQSEETKQKRLKAMKKTMAEKFPEENRRKKLSDEERKEYYSNKAKANWSTPGFKEAVSSKISEALKASKDTRSRHMSSTRWWNNGIINTRTIDCPGDGYVLGKL